MAIVGLEFAAFWAVLIALLNFIPYIGAVVGIALPVAMAIVQFASPGEVLSLLLSLVVIHALVLYFLDSQLMGKSLNLGPLAILASLTVWSELCGVPGRVPGDPDHGDHEDRLRGIRRHAADRRVSFARRPAVTTRFCRRCARTPFSADRR